MVSRSDISEIISTVDSDIFTSSAPKSIASSIRFSSFSDLVSKRINPFSSNCQDTAPDSARFPPDLVKEDLRDDIVLFLLSVRVLTINPVPSGP